jgi:hypothetical protein
MIAEAVLEEVKNSKNISVDIATIRFTDKKLGQRFIYLTPPIAQQSLVDFDQGREVKPFGFELRTAVQVTPKKTRSGKGNYRKKKIVLATPENASHQPAVVIGSEVPPIAPLSSSGAGRVTARIRRFGAHNLEP